MELRDGTWQVGPAGEVEFAVRDGGLELEVALVDGRLQLVDATANAGWAMRVEEDKPSEIEVELTNGPVEWEFEAELDDGELEVEIECELTGRFPA